MKDSSEGCKFELHSKALTGPSAATLPITLAAHKEEVKARWLSEIRSFAADQVALQEHATDDLRIDPSHVQQIDVQVLKLPQRIDSADPDSGIRPSDFAKDHFLTKSQRRVDDKFESQTVATSSSSSVKSVVVQESSSVQISTESSASVVDKKLQRSSAVESSTSQDLLEVTGEKHSISTSVEESPSKLQKVSEKVSRIPVKTDKPKEDVPEPVKKPVEENNKRQAEEEEKQRKEAEDKRKADEEKQKEAEEKRKADEKKREREEEENERRRKEDLRILEEKRRAEEEFAKRQEELTKQQERRKAQEVEEERERKSQEEAERKVQLKNEENLRKIQEAGAIDIRVVETVKTETEVVVKVATEVAPTKGEPPAIRFDQAAGGASDNQSPSSSKQGQGNVKEVPLKKIASKPIEDPDPPDRKPPQRNADGSHPPTVIPDFNPPPALVYHTTFEVSLHKEPLPPPAVPPKITHKVVVHNESLEQRTEEFLRGNCEFDAINYSLSSAQSKIKDIKSTFGKSKKETDLVEDTVRKAKSGEFHSIVHPPVPLEDPHQKHKGYEVVEIVEQPGECDKLPADLQRKYEITKELLLTKKEQKMSSSSSSYYTHEGKYASAAHGVAFHQCFVYQLKLSLIQCSC